MPDVIIDDNTAKTTSSSASTTTTVAATTSAAKDVDTPVVTSGDTNRPVPIVDTETPNIGASDEDGKMPFEDAQKIFVPIIVIFTVVSIALAIGFIIKAGKTASAIKYGGIFIGTWFKYTHCFDMKNVSCVIIILHKDKIT